MFEYAEKDIQCLSDAMRRGEITAASLTEYYLTRIERYDKQGPCLNSIILINPSVCEDAAMLDEERKAGKIRSVLHGIPIVIKDNIDMKKLPTTAGSTLLKRSIPDRDAFLVAKLRQAGAILLAKANLSEFSRGGLSASSLGGQTHNPYDLTRTPGGSSGGTGAAVAANMASAGIGADNVNSVRSPCSANCLVGIRPTTGLISRTGLLPSGLTQDTAGTMARMVSDAVLLLEACAGYDPTDPKTAESVGRCQTSYATHLNAQGVRGKRIGLMRNNYGGDTDVLRIMKRAENVLLELGAELVPLDIPELEADMMTSTCDVKMFDKKPNLGAYFGSIANCPVKDIEELVASGKLHPTIAESMAQCARIENPLQHPEYHRRLYLVAEKRTLAYQIMAQHRLDAFLYPHQRILVEPIANKTQRGGNGIMAAALGFPAITLPGGFSDPTETAPLGVPIGIEFMARPYDEPTLIEIAFGFERHTHYRVPPASTPFSV